MTKAKKEYRLPPERLDEITNLLKDHTLSDTTIAHKLGIPPQNVYYWRKKLKIPRNLDPYKEQIWDLYVKQRKSMKEVCALLDISYNKLYRYMIANSFPIRSPNLATKERQAKRETMDEDRGHYPDIASALASEIKEMAKELNMSEHDFREYMNTPEGTKYCLKHQWR